MEIEIEKWKDKFAKDFIRLSVEWLEKYVRVEPADEALLYHPHKGPRNLAVDYTTLGLYFFSISYAYVLAFFQILVVLAQ